MKFIEDKLEKSFIKLLENEGFPHCLGNTISRADDEVLIEEDLKNYLNFQTGVKEKILNRL